MLLRFAWECRGSTKPVKTACSALPTRQVAGQRLGSVHCACSMALSMVPRYSALSPGLAGPSAAHPEASGKHFSTAPAGVLLQLLAAQMGISDFDTEPVTFNPLIKAAWTPTACADHPASSKACRPP